MGLQNPPTPAAADGNTPTDLGAEGKQRIFNVILGANYMDVKCLLHLGCAKIATYIKGKGPEEIKQILANNNQEIVAGVARAAPASRRRRLSKDSRSILSKMFGVSF